MVWQKDPFSETDEKCTLVELVQGQGEMGDTLYILPAHSQRNVMFEIGTKTNKTEFFISWTIQKNQILFRLQIIRKFTPI